MKHNEIISLMQEMAKIGLTKLMIEQEGIKLILEKKNINTQFMEEPANEKVMSNGTMLNNQVPKETMANTATESNNMANNAEYDGSTNNKDDIPGTKKILSPMVGTFYAQPAPDKPSFVNIGDVIKKGQTVCIIEAMKLMNEIESEVEGEIIECLVENEDMVEFGQPLFIMK